VKCGDVEMWRCGVADDSGGGRNSIHLDCTVRMKPFEWNRSEEGVGMVLDGIRDCMR